MARVLNIAFLWHMHQPDYRDPATGTPVLPWVRLHAIKDYLHMADLIADYPTLHATFNFTPTLVEQIRACAERRAMDRWEQLATQRVWSRADKEFSLAHFFSINPDRFIRRYPRYWQLYQIAQRAEHFVEFLTDQFFLDLVGWFNLAWFDPTYLARDAKLAALANREHFDADDITEILAQQHTLAARLLPRYAELAARGQIELSTSPYHHPILPLLIDTRAALEAAPQMNLPAVPFVYPEDAAEQIRRALSAHAEYFTRAPQGLWPSEGSISQALLAHFNNGLRWIASDEGVLAQSLGVKIERDGDGHLVNPRVLCQPYTVEKTRAAVAILFRDHLLSDRIGFVYQHLAAEEAVKDFITRLHTVCERLDDEDAYLLPIILDGENAWESYPNNGEDFFRALYTHLAADDALRTVTISEFLREHPPRATLPRLVAGSWINANFDTWIGEPAHNHAWELLARTREDLTAWQRDYPLADDELLARAWEELYSAEGSDWFWWFSSRNDSEQDRIFDELFRGHLQQVYLALGLPVPETLKQPIEKIALRMPARAPLGYLFPKLTAEPTASEAWRMAGVLPAARSTGTMQRAEATRFTQMLFGYNPNQIFIRVEAHESLAAFRLGVYLSTPRAAHFNQRPRFADLNVTSATWGGLAWEIEIAPAVSTVAVYRADGQEVWKPASLPVQLAARDNVVELALPLAELGLELGDTVGLLVTLIQDHTLVESLPASGLHTLALTAFG